MHDLGYNVREIATHLDINLSAVRGVFLYERREVSATPFDLGDVKRSVYGGKKKFTDDEVRSIRESKESVYKLADKYGVAHNTIHQIKKMLTYKKLI